MTSIAHAGGAKPGLLMRMGVLNFDPMSMAVFRMVFAAYIAYNRYSLASYTMLFTDQGVLPRDVLRHDWPGLENLSLLELCDDPLFHAAFRVLQLVAIVAFGIGYCTRLATIILAVCGISLSWRNPLNVSHIPLLTDLLLIWSCFLPLGRTWSVDAALDPLPRDRPYPTVPLLAMKLQLASIYFFAGLFKLAGHIWLNGMAVINALQSDVYGRPPLAPWLVEHVPSLLYAANYGVIGFQLLFTFLVYSPVANAYTRAFALLGAATMHASFLIFMRVGSFPLLSMCYLLLMVPDLWWEKLLAARRRHFENVRIYYDADCDFCRKVGLLLREACLPWMVPVLPATANAEALALLQAHKSWVVYDAKGRARLKWDAVAYVMRQSFILFPLGLVTGLPFLRPVMNRLYDGIGASRGLLGRVTGVLLPWRSPRAPGVAVQVVCVFMAVLALASNLILTPMPEFGDDRKWVESLAPTPGGDNAWVESPFSQKILKLAGIFQVRQMWNIFAPDPTGWRLRIAMVGYRKDGSAEDYSDHLPHHIYWFDGEGGLHLPTYIKTYLLRLPGRPYAAEQRAFAQYLCREINRSSSSPDAEVVAIGLRFHFMRPDEVSWPKKDAPPRLRKYQCPASPS